MTKNITTDADQHYFYVKASLCHFTGQFTGRAAQLYNVFYKDQQKAVFPGTEENIVIQVIKDSTFGKIGFEKISGNTDDIKLPAATLWSMGSIIIRY